MKVLDFHKYIWVSNHEIHKEANLPIETFLEKISGVEALRSNERTFSFTTYPISKDGYEKNFLLWDYIHSDRNALNGNRKNFIAGFHPDLYYFLLYSKRSDIFSPIVVYLAGLYVLQYEERHILESQLYKPILDKVLEVVKTYFYGFLGITEDDYYIWESLLIGISEEGNIQRARQYQRFMDCYDAVFGKLTKNASILYKYLNPFERAMGLDNSNLLLKRGMFDVAVPTAYMRDDDWKHIIEDGKTDKLLRAESDKDLYKRWKHDTLLHHDELTYEFVFQEEE